MSNPNEEPILSSSPDGSDDPGSDHLKVNNNTLTMAEQAALLRTVLPSLNGQEGSPANTFTQSELNTLQQAVGKISVGPSSSKHARKLSTNTIDIRDVQLTFQQPVAVSAAAASSFDVFATPAALAACPQDGSEEIVVESSSSSTPTPSAAPLAWHGAPRLHPKAFLARDFRQQVRSGDFQGPTNGVCPGFLQCNLVVLPQGQVAFDFLLFCQRNPKSCPLIEVCDVGSPYPSGVAPGADLRTDVPKYSIYRNGQLEREVTDVTAYWPEQSVAFLIGCSFSYDGALMDAGIPLKSAQQGKNVPMYKTSLKCRPSGSLKGNMVVSMKPIPALQVSKHIEITSKYTHAHGGPVAVGSASAIGVADIIAPEWGEAIDVAPDEVPIFHACGVTPQSILMDSKVPFAITHSAGHMFVTDLPSDMGV